MQITGTDVRNDLSYKIGFIGGSKAGTAFANYLIESGINVSGFYSYNFDSAITSAQITKTKAYASLEILLSNNDIIVISVADRYIKDIWQKLKQHKLAHKIILHLSGFLSSSIFDNYEKYNLGVASLHLPVSFANKESIPKEIRTAPFVIEGNSAAVEIINQIAKKTNNHILEIKTIDKAKYHAACVLSSSLVLAQLKSASNIIKETLSLLNQSSVVEELVLNLATSALNNAQKTNIISAVTGPMARNDSETIKTHIKVLQNSENQILYKILSNILLEHIPLEIKQNLQNILR